MAAGPARSPPTNDMGFFCKVPWIQLLFSDRTILEARSFYRSDGARTYREAGLGQMSIAKFERVVRDCGLKGDIAAIRLRQETELSAWCARGSGTCDQSGELHFVGVAAGVRGYSSSAAAARSGGDAVAFFEAKPNLGAHFGMPKV